MSIGSTLHGKGKKLRFASYKIDSLLLLML